MNVHINDPDHMPKMVAKAINSKIRSLSGKFDYTFNIFNRKRNAVKMNISGFAQIFHEQIDEIL